MFLINEMACAILFLTRIMMFKYLTLAVVLVSGTSSKQLTIDEYQVFSIKGRKRVNSININSYKSS